MKAILYIQLIICTLITAGAATMAYAAFFIYDSAAINYKLFALTILVLMAIATKLTFKELKNNKL